MRSPLQPNRPTKPERSPRIGHRNPQQKSRQRGSPTGRTQLHLRNQRNTAINRHRARTSQLRRTGQRRQFTKISLRLVRMNHRRIGQRSHPRAKISRRHEKLNPRLIRRRERISLRRVRMKRRRIGQRSHPRERISRRHEKLSLRLIRPPERINLRRVRMNHRRIGQRSRPRAKISRPRERINLRLVRISRPPIRPLARINRLLGRTSHRREQVSLRQTGKRRRRTGLSLRRTKTHRNRRRLQKPTSRTRHRKRRSRPKIKRTRKRNLRARNLAGYGRSVEPKRAVMGTARHDRSSTCRSTITDFQTTDAIVRGIFFYPRVGV